jgi:hypothetical protein
MYHQSNLGDPCAETGNSDVTRTLLACACSASEKTRLAVAACYGHIDPFGFFDALSQLLKLGCSMKELLVGLDYTENALDGIYYDSIYGCPGYLHALNSEEQLQGHFYCVHKYFEKAVRFFPYDRTEFIRDLLQKLTPKGAKSEEAESAGEPSFRHSPNNLLFSFMDDCEGEQRDPS